MNADTLNEIRRRIQINEGCRLTPYQDTVGVWTVGYGFNLEKDTQQSIAELLAHCGVTAPLSVIERHMPITQEQADALFNYELPSYINAARSSLAAGIFDTLDPARQFVVVDLTYNLGLSGWTDFAETRNLIIAGQRFKNANDLYQATLNFTAAANHLEESAWYGQVGNRAKRDVVMMRESVWVNATGDGSF